MVKKLQARNEPRKGRGFGFVTLGSEDLQKKAVDEMNGKQIEVVKSLSKLPLIALVKKMVPRVSRALRMAPTAPPRRSPPLHKWQDQIR